jgi:hypothetical protein
LPVDAVDRSPLTDPEAEARDLSWAQHLLAIEQSVTLEQ